MVKPNTSGSLIVAVVLMSALANAAAIVTPPGLQPGDTYRIIFATSTARNALSSDIADYNTFVTDAANLDANLSALSTTWRALASTALVNVFANAGLSGSDTTTQFYNTRGQRIAVGTLVPGTGLYGGITTSHENQIFTETGGTPASIVHTGTRLDGTTYISTSPPGLMMAGVTNWTAYQWTDAGPVGSEAVLPFYGISGALTIADVPEPGSIALTCVGTVVLLLRRRFRRDLRNRQG